jgi:hypothetical protein
MTAGRGLRFRANDLLADAKLTALLAAHDRDGCAPAASGIGGTAGLVAARSTLVRP